MIEAAEELVLGLVETQVHLREGAPKDEHQGQREADDRQAQRREEADQAVQKRIQGHANPAPGARYLTDCTNFMNASFSCWTTSALPMNL